MSHPLFLTGLRLWLVTLMFVVAGAATAAEPTLKQVYDAAQAGRVDEAQTMMQQVLVAHPNSAKAHFVNAELLLRRGHPEEARKALSTAEKLAPGLPFAKPEAVEALRSRLVKSSSSRTDTATQRGSSEAAGIASGGIPWMLLLVGGGAAVALMLFLRRRKAAAVSAGPLTAGPAFGNTPGGTWPQPHAPGAQFGAAHAPPGYGQPGYGQAGYGQPGHGHAGSGLGGRLMGGLATGLAVGAGVMAAQAIGKTLSGNDEPGGAGGDALAGGAADYDMGGESFGVADGGGWDDGAVGGVDGGGEGGGDW